MEASARKSLAEETLPRAPRLPSLLGIADA